MAGVGFPKNAAEEDAQWRREERTSRRRETAGPGAFIVVTAQDIRLTRYWIVDVDFVKDILDDKSLNKGVTITDPKASGKTYNGDWEQESMDADRNDDGSATVTQVLLQRGEFS